ncbi:uncharacterized protein Dana_GF25034 [Drosophila ananassae]|uniref:Uncharacterized protein n=1 Tax=Drosophila ananassae TaxID=7217 RepID=A0A0P8XSN1_DROAN|nr:uncharacterized protein Dana_GF25034 [Drosophila ananassae]
MWPGSERGSSRALELPTSQQNAGGSSQQETLADIEHISTIAGSLASIGSISHTQMRYQCTNDAGYETEHTSLNSDFDEAELRRELLRDKWKLLFDMFDPEGFGEISVTEFLVALKSPEFLSQVPMNKRELLLERAKKAQLPTGPGYVTFQDFVNVLARDKSFYGSAETLQQAQPLIWLIWSGGGPDDDVDDATEGRNVLNVMTTAGTRLTCPAG